MNRQPVATASSFYGHLYAPQHAAVEGQYHEPVYASTLGYRPLQQLSSLQAPQPSLEHLGLAASAFHHLSFRPHHQQQAAAASSSLTTSTPRARRHSRRQLLQQDNMALPNMSEEEQAQFQELSNKYEPEVTGPLVGQRETSTNITVEYAAADPVYQAKTANLPQKYSHYRTVRGDGRCGWRAIGFGYLETLIHLGDSGKFLEEEVRLKSLTNVLIAAGYSQDLFEDFADETYELLRKVGAALQTGNTETVLYEAFNDETVQNYIITHLRLLTAAWMKTRPGDYAPWLIGQTVEQFCENQVMPMAAEIDNVSLIALKDVLLSPAGIALEVLYLDRTEGSEVNMHRFDPVGHPVTIGTIRLLYRPGHYDILYKTEDIPQSINPVTYLHYSTSHHYEPVQDLGVSDFMTMIPGMSYASPSSGWMSGSSYGSDLFAPTSTQQCAQGVTTPVTPAPQPQHQPQPSQYLPTTPSQLVAPPLQMPQEMAIRTVPHATLAPPAFQSQLSGPFRPSIWELEPDFAHATSQSLPFQTSIFKNSHFNTAHFLNPDFQPEEWKPDDEYVTSSSSKGTRHKG